MERIRNGIVLAATASVLMCCAGCSLAGYGIGTVIDKDRGKQLTSYGTEVLYDMEKGDRFAFSRADGMKEEVAFLGLLPPDPKVLLRSVRDREKEAESRHRILPGDRLHLTEAGRGHREVVFLGADSASLWYRMPRENEVLQCAYMDIKSLRSGSVAFGRGGTYAFLSGALSGVYDVEVVDASGTVRIPMRDIDSLWCLEYPTGTRLILGGIGLAVDFAAIIALSMSQDDPPPKPKKDANDKGTLMCGCPFLYGWTGEQWRFETECFSGAVFRAAQRRDLARLEYCRPADTILHLRLRNKLLETDSIDQVTLLRVEHDAGSMVVPTEDGRMLAVHPLPPRLAIDDRGVDVTARLQCHKDGSCWRALPGGDSGRCSVEAEFGIPLHRDSVTLILHVQNTPWAARMQAAFFSLFGSSTQSMHDRWNSDPIEAAQLRAALLREGMMAVSVCDGSEWRPVGHVWEVGLGAYRAVSLRIPVPARAGGILRLRFAAPSGMWMLGSVGVDAALPGRVAVSRYSPAEVISIGGGSVSADLLHREDGRYVSLDTGEGIDMQFALPCDKRPTNNTVTWMVETAGYYRMKVDETHPPQPTMLARLLGESGCFALWQEEAFLRESVVAAER